MLRRKIHKEFNRIYNQAKKKENRYPFDSKNELLVLFSDHHKGDLSPADDFKKTLSYMMRSYHTTKKKDISSWFLEITKNSGKSLRPNSRKLQSINYQRNRNSSGKP